MIDLLEYAHRPCPWCDSTDQNFDLDYANDTMQVFCQECGAAGPEVSNITSPMSERKRAALDAWNGGWEPSEADQGLIPIPEGYAEQ